MLKQKLNSLRKFRKYFAILVFLFQPQVIIADALTDGSVGAVQNLSGNMLIPESLGKLSGGNLFHSFKHFNIYAGESAQFTTVTPTVNNVITRVTGGEASAINGALTLESAGNPAFIFINPAGVAFGEGASINVPGAFHVSTANRLNFADGNVLETDASKVSSFSSAPPESFGFMADQSAKIEINQNVVLSTPDSSLSFIAGDITINGGIENNAGDIQIYANGVQEKAIPLNQALPEGSGIITVNGGDIRTISSANQKGGRIELSAGKLALDGGEGTSSIASLASFDGGNAGDLLISVQGELIARDAFFSSDTFGSGNAGDVTIIADDMALIASRSFSSRVSSESNFFGAAAGNINLLIKNTLDIIDANISSNSFTNGKAGNINIEAGDLNITGSVPYISTFIASGSVRSFFIANKSDAGNVNINVARDLNVKNANISSDTYTLGDAGTVVVRADNINLETANITSSTNNGGLAGNVEVNVGQTLQARAGSSVSSDSFSGEQAGTVIVNAKDILLVGGDDQTSWISSIAHDNSGDAGSVMVNASNNIQVIDATITSSSFGLGGAGNVDVKAKNIDIIRDTRFSSIASDVADNSIGNAGNVQIEVDETLKIVNGGSVSSKTAGNGNAGTVTIAANDIVLISENAAERSNINSLSLLSDGNAGNVYINVRDALNLSKSYVSSDTSGAGVAGSVVVNAGDITLDDSWISSGAIVGTGDAGNVVIFADNQLNIANGSFISSATKTAGKGGSVDVLAKQIHIDGEDSQISAEATSGSSGQTGSVSVEAVDLLKLTNAGRISLKNDASVTTDALISPTKLSVTADRITLLDASITAESTANVDASNIEIYFQNLMYLDPSAITTRARDGNGGAILINGDGLLLLEKSQITTSVSGLSGDGGNISINTKALALNTGFVQANTAAANASGGDIAINVPVLVVSGNNLVTGGDFQYVFDLERFGYNVIQAAAPDGISGDINVTAPELDISETLSVLGVNFFNAGQVARNPCQAAIGSSFSVLSSNRSIDSVPNHLLLSKGAINIADHYWDRGCQ